MGIPYRKIAVIVNPRSANGETGRRWPTLERDIRDVIGPFKAFVTERSGHGAELTREALRNGYERIVSVGGDGTHHEVLNGFFDGYLPINPAASLAIVPQGTGSDLARLLALSRESDAIALIASPTAAKIDIGRVTFTQPGGGTDVRYFVNIADFGAGGAVTERVNRHSKALGGFLSFLWGLLKTLATYRAPVMRLQIDGLFLEQRCMDVILANGQYYGGGIHVAPEAQLDSGTFEVFVIGRLSILQGLLHLRSFYTGDLKSLKKLVKCFNASRIVAQSTGNVLVNLDGEVPGQLPAAFEILPSALNLVVAEPAGSRTTTARPGNLVSFPPAQPSQRRYGIGDAAAEAVAPLATPATPRTAVIVNPHAANGRTGKRWPLIEKRIHSTVGDFVRLVTERPGHATELTRRALKEGCERIVCVGGDGTLQEVVNGFFEGMEPIRPDARLAVLPEGTASDFTRTVGTHRENEALSVLESTKTMPVDVGRVVYASATGRRGTGYFINCAHIGAAGNIAERFNRYSKPFRGLGISLRGILATALTYRNTVIALEIDGHEFEERCHTVIVASGRYAGGGMLVAPEAELTSGQFEVCVIGDVSAWQAIKNIPKLYRGELGRRPDIVTYFKASHIVARSTERVLLSLEGEQTGQLPATIDCLPGAIQLLVPEEVRPE